MLAILLATVYSACEINWATLKSSASQDPAFRVLERRSEILNAPTEPWLWDRLEGRYQLDGFDGKKHELGVRLQMPVWGEKSATRKVDSTQRELLRAKEISRLQSQIARRTKAGIEYQYRVDKQALLDSLEQVLLDKKSALIALQGNNQFNPLDLLETEQDITQLRSERISGLAELADSKQRLARLSQCYDGPIQLSPLPNPSTLSQAVADSTTKIGNSPRALLSRARTNLARSRMDLERTTESRILAWTELGVDLKAEEDGVRYIEKKDLKASVGIRLPWGDGSARKVIRDRLNLLSTEMEQAENDEDLSQDEKELRGEISTLLAQHTLLANYRKQLLDGALWEDFRKVAASTPLVLLKARHQNLQSALKLRRLELEIQRRSIDLQELRGELAPVQATQTIR